MARIIAKRLESVRRARGLSQRALSEAAGITRQAVGAIESGRMQPSVGIALGLARALGTTVEELFGNQEEPELPAARVAVGTVGARTVSHALDRDHLAIEPSHTIASTVFVAGCDVAVGLLSRHAMACSRDVHAVWLSMTNRAALDALAKGNVHAAVVHGDVDGARLRALGDLLRLEVATTEEGWLVASGNPLRLRGAADLVRGRMRFVNRPGGAGARRLLDEQLRRAKIDPRRILGYGLELAGQLDAGRAIAQGFADAAVGAASVARVFGLDFLPLREERCTLLIPRTYARDAGVKALLDALRSSAYRRDLDALDSYVTDRTGEAMA
jgi:putative molybdopterin biosynthesis protein